MGFLTTIELEHAFCLKCSGRELDKPECASYRRACPIVPPGAISNTATIIRMHALKVARGVVVVVVTVVVVVPRAFI